jgi:fibronectin-binding autotransporter adhesin
LTLRGSESIAAAALSSGTLAATTGMLSVGAGGVTVESGLLSANLGGTAQLMKTTDGTVVLSGNNGYTGGTSLSGGVLQLGSGGALPDGGAVTLNAGMLDLNGQSPTIGALGSTLTTGAIGNSGTAAMLTVNTAATTTYSGLISDGNGTIGLAKQGSGSLTLGGNNSYTGGTTVSGGMLQLNSSTALGSTSGGLTVNAGTLDLAGQSPTVGALQSALTTGVVASNGAPAVLTVNNAANNSFSGLIVNGASGGSVGLVKMGGGTLTLANSSNGYSGGTSITAGVLAIEKAGNLGAGSLTLGGGTLQTTADLTIDAAVSLTNSAAGIDVHNSGNTATLAGLITGSGGLNLVGPGTLALTNNSGGNLYGGATNVLSGTLLAEADNALSPNSNLVIGDGATVVLDFGGGSGDAIVTPTIPVPAALAIPAVPMAAGLAPGAVSAVPEPSALVLVIAGVLCGAGLWLKRRRK